MNEEKTGKTLFEKIASGELPSFKIWEDDAYMAFLSLWPNTPGFSVVIPKKNVGDYIFSMEDDAIAGLMVAAKKVAKLLEKALDVPRVAVIFEGTGVPHVHAKLIPLHGQLGGETGVYSKHQEFYPEYEGYLTTAEGPRMNDEELLQMQEKIKKAAS